MVDASDLHLEAQSKTPLVATLAARMWPDHNTAIMSVSFPSSLCCSVCSSVSVLKILLHISYSISFLIHRLTCRSLLYAKHLKRFDFYIYSTFFHYCCDQRDLDLSFRGQKSTPDVTLTEDRSLSLSRLT